MGMTKKEIISNLRVAEHNHLAVKESFENCVKEIVKNYKYMDHAQWLNEDECHKCSKCGAVLEEDFHWHCHNYYYHCGARMDGEENEIL